jgi:hypothetical protein
LFRLVGLFWCSATGSFAASLAWRQNTLALMRRLREAFIASCESKGDGMKNNLIAMSLLFAGLAAPVSASATTITFDNGAGNWTLDATANSFTDSGFTFTNNGSDMGVWGGTSPNSNGTNNNIFAGFAPNDFEAITKTGGGTFSLASLDLAISWFDPNQSETITINGTPLTITNVLTTYSLNLNNISELDISGVPSQTGYWSADNFVINTSAVPEPSTWAMMILGFFGVGFMAHRRRTTAPSVADTMAM